MKRCPGCNTSKPLSAFGKDRARSDGLTWRCRDCVNDVSRDIYHANPGRDHQRNRRWKARNADAVWAHRLKMKHGMRPEQWYAMWTEQRGNCYLCERPLPEDRTKVAVDHDHRHCPRGRSCGHCRRGLAHQGCNTGIGLLEDDPALLRLVAGNLERAKDLTAALLAVAPVQGELLPGGS